MLEPENRNAPFSLSDARQTGVLPGPMIKDAAHLLSDEHDDKPESPPDVLAGPQHKQAKANHNQGDNQTDSPRQLRIMLKRAELDHFRPHRIVDTVKDARSQNRYRTGDRREKPATTREMPAP